MTIESRIDAPGWAAMDFARIAEAAIGATLAHFDMDRDECEISVLATDDAEVAELNATYRGKPQPTNVLSWPAQDLSAQSQGGEPEAPFADAFGEVELGDIALAFETCQREAEASKKPLADHVTHLIVHGTLHLLGYDHVHDEDAALMERLETIIVRQLGLDDPYGDVDGF